MIELTSLPQPLILTLCCLGGLLLGFAYFKSLLSTSKIIVEGGSPLLGLALSLGRYAFIGAAFYAAVLAGAPALLATLLGFLCAKQLMLYQTRNHNV